MIRVSIAELENEVKASEDRLASAKVDLQRAKVMRSQVHGQPVQKPAAFSSRPSRSASRSRSRA